MARRGPYSLWLMAPVGATGNIILKPSILALAVSAIITGFAHPAFAENSPQTSPQDTAQAQSAPMDGAAAAQPMLKKPAPRRQASETTLVVGGILGAAAVVGLVAGADGGDDQPSSP